ncbi:hypothetical protein FRB99_004360, partial [Tulasnella sp. 403]
MSDASSSSAPPSPSTSVTSVDAVQPPLGNLSLKDVSDEDKAAAAELKKQANKAFT